MHKLWAEQSNTNTMKQQVFNEMLSKVCDLFEIEKDELLSKTKNREAVDARHMLYYLCRKRPMRLTSIQSFLSKEGFDTAHSAIHHGINRVEIKVNTDKDYRRVVKELSS